MKYIILIFAISFYSCEVFESTYYIQPEVNPYMDRFYKEASERGYNFHRNNLIITIEDLTPEHPTRMGETIRKSGFGDDQITVHIDDNIFDDPSDSLRIEYTLFHEMGHALLRRDHNNTWSLMDYHVSLEEYKKDRKRLIDELFYGS